MKDGYKTTEFWLTLLVSIWALVSGSVPAPWDIALPIIAAGLYSISRGLAKLGYIRGDVGEYLNREG